MYHACMVALQIRGVSAEVRDALVAQARERGQSLQALLLGLVEAEARRACNREVLSRFSGRCDGTRSAPGETAAELARLRGENGTGLAE